MRGALTKSFLIATIINSGLRVRPASLIYSKLKLMRTSIRQVAERAGVSAMTVSNVLRNRTERMAPETRERVLSAVHALDYVPVRTAAQNRHVTTNALGVVFIQEMQGAVGYPTFLGMCARAQADRP